MPPMVRRYEGIDAGHKDELTKKVGETLIPRLRKLPGFGDYFLIDTGDGVMSSISLFETSSQAGDSTRVASEWVRDEKLERILTTPPKVTEGEVIVRKTNEAVLAYLGLNAAGVRRAGGPSDAREAEMKSITTSGSFRKADSSLDVTLNPVELPSKEIVSWGIAFPWPGSDAMPAHIDVVQTEVIGTVASGGGQGLAT